MAKASTLASTIYRNFLQCGICFENFDDPRALPCLHAFCYKCLKQWAGSCSKDNSIIRCPLCSEVYPIPADKGIRGFPAHFLVTNLQTKIDTGNQRANSDYCNNHEGKRLEYFCENCDFIACSDCCAIDPSHTGHTFMQLKEASQQYRTSLEMLTRRIGEEEKKYTASIQQIQQVKCDLDKDADAKVATIDEVRNEYVQLVDNVIEIFKQNIHQKKADNLMTLDQTEKKLQVDLESIRSSSEQATGVLASGSNSLIAASYSSMSSAMHDLVQPQPPVDDKLGQVHLDPPTCTNLDLTSLEQMLCDKLNIADATTQHPSGSDAAIPHQVTKPSKARRSSLISQSAANLVTKYLGNNTPTEQNQNHPKHTSKDETSSKFGLFSRRRSSSTASIDPSLNRPKHDTDPPHRQYKKEWKEYGKINTSPQAKSPQGIAVHPNGDIVLTSEHAPVAVFSKKGNFKHVIKNSPSGIQEIAVTPNDEYIVPNTYGNDVIYKFDSQGVLVGSIPRRNFGKKPSRAQTVAADSTGRIVVGLQKSVSIHQPDGSLISTFETSSPPRKITCAPNNALIVSFDDNTLQVMHQSGANMSIIQPPPDIQLWKPQYVCCSEKEELYVGNQGDPMAVYRYVLTISGEYKYSDCVVRLGLDPYGIALSPNGKRLFVVDYWSSAVKIFH